MILYLGMDPCSVSFNKKNLKNLSYSFRVQAVLDHSGVSKAVLQIIISWQITIPKHEFTVCWGNSLAKPLFVVTGRRVGRSNLSKTKL